MDYYDENDDLKSSDKQYEKSNRKRNKEKKHFRNKKETFNICIIIIIILIIIVILILIFNRILNSERNSFENKINKLNLEIKILLQNNSLLIKEKEHYKNITTNILGKSEKYNDFDWKINKAYKIVAISYGDAKFSNQLKINGRSALEIAKVDEFYGYTPNDIDPKFKEKNKDILDRPRGNGYWLWKPYFLYRTMKEKLDYGDFLIYSDAGILYIDAAQKLVDFLNKKKTDVYMHRLPHLEKHFTKKTAFILLGAIGPFYAETGQFNAAFQIYRKTKFTEFFLKEYLYFAQDKRIITDDPNEPGVENYPDFKEHRHDQSILSLLVKKYGLVNSNKANVDLNAAKNFTEEMPTIFCHYRRRGGDYESIKNMCKDIRGNVL